MYIYIHRHLNIHMYLYRYTHTHVYMCIYHIYTHLKNVNEYIYICPTLHPVGHESTWTCYFPWVPRSLSRAFAAPDLFGMNKNRADKKCIKFHSVGWTLSGDHVRKLNLPGRLYAEAPVRKSLHERCQQLPLGSQKFDQLGTTASPI